MNETNNQDDFQDENVENINIQQKYYEIGNKLKKIREDKNISYSEVINSIKIPQRFLEAIENGEWHIIPNSIYTRAFIRDYAKILEIDIEPDLNSVFPKDQLKPEIYIDHNGISKLDNFNSSASTSKKSNNWTLFLVSILLIAIIIAILMAVFNLDKKIIEFLNFSDSQSDVIIKPIVDILPEKNSDDLNLSDSDNIQNTRQENHFIATNTIEFENSEINSQNINFGISENENFEDETIEKAETEETIIANVQSTPSVITSNQLVITTTDQSWVQAIKITGQIIFEKTIQKDEDFSKVIEKPFHLIIGNAKSVNAVYEDQPLLVNTQLTKNGNARLLIE